jgi:hypothetical protein
VIHVQYFLKQPRVITLLNTFFSRSEKAASNKKSPTPTNETVAIRKNLKENNNRYKVSSPDHTVF